MSEKRPRKTNDINVKNVNQDIFDYVTLTGITMTAFAKMAMREKIERDKKLVSRDVDEIQPITGIDLV